MYYLLLSLVLYICVYFLKMILMDGSEFSNSNTRVLYKNILKFQSFKFVEQIQKKNKIFGDYKIARFILYYK